MLGLQSVHAPITDLRETWVSPIPCDAAQSPALCDSGFVHRPVRPVRSTHLAVHQCRRLLESSTAAPPSLNRQLGMVMLRWLPRYTFSVMFSRLTTRAVRPGYTCTSATHTLFQIAVLRTSACKSAPSL